MRITWYNTLVALTGLTLVGSLWHVSRVDASEAVTRPVGHLASTQKTVVVPLGQTAGLAAYDEGEGGGGEDGGDPDLKGKLSPQQASDTALKAQPGAVTGVSLEDENGAVVWSVLITASDGKKYDVKVDDNTNSVIKVESDSDVG